MLKHLLLLAGALGLAGCVLAPGMYAGGIDEGEEVIARHPDTGERIKVPVYPLSYVPGEAREDTGKLPPDLYFLDYQIGPGDVVSITVWDHPELTIPQGEFRSAEAAGNLIGRDGTLFYPYCGTIKAAGLTQSELRDRLRGCLSRVIRNPQVEVRVIGFESQRAVIGGAVVNPGVIPLRNTPVRVAEAIQAAGGLLPEADLRHVVLNRGKKRFEFDYKAYTETGDERLNPLLLSGDKLHITSSTERQISVLGEVQRPQTLGLNDEVRTLADALAASFGLSPETAQSDRILVMRSEQDRPVVHWLRGDDPLTLLAAQNFRLQPGDVVYVDQTGLARWGRVISQLLPSFTAINAGSAAATR